MMLFNKISVYILFVVFIFISFNIYASDDFLLQEGDVIIWEDNKCEIVKEVDTLECLIFNHSVMSLYFCAIENRLLSYEDKFNRGDCNKKINEKIGYLHYVCDIPVVENAIIENKDYVYQTYNKEKESSKRKNGYFFSVIDKIYKNQICKLINLNKEGRIVLSSQILRLIIKSEIIYFGPYYIEGIKIENNQMLIRYSQINGSGYTIVSLEKKHDKYFITSEEHFIYSPVICEDS
jgi:hypothetical protein